MKTNPIRYSSAVGKVWTMMNLKARYCHNIFDKQEIREFVKAMLFNTLLKYEIRHRTVGFDSNLVHITLDLGTRSNILSNQLEEFYAVVDIIRNYFYGILNYFCYGITNAIVEGYNTKINIIKRRAYGFRDLEYFMLKIYQSSLRRLV